MKMWVAGAIGLLASLAAIDEATGAVRRVPGDYESIQAAVDASAGTDTVLIADGVYRGQGNHEVSVIGKNLLIKGEHGPETTVVDCQQDGRFITVDGGAWSIVIQGLTVENGNVLDFGGAVLSGLATPTLRDCSFVRNSAGDGGAVWASGDIVVQRCTFAANQSTHNGGGAIHLLGIFYGRAQIEGCVFSGNTAGPAEGGAVKLDSGGGIYTLPVEACTFFGNSAADGGAIWAGDMVFRMERTICLGNCGTNGEDDDIVAHGGAAIQCSDVNRMANIGEITYSDVIESDPLFCDPMACGLNDSGDYHLRSESPCLPANSPCGELIGALGLGCVGPATGACCLPDGFCLIEEQQQCADQHGIYMGDGSACVPDPCHSTPTKSTTWGAIKSSFK